MRTPESAAPVAWLSMFPAHFRRKISQGAYRAEIDGLRFFAIAFVIFGHSIERAARFFPSYESAVAGKAFEAFLQLAPPGVFLFFAISGYILAGQATKAKESPLSPAFLKSYFGAPSAPYRTALYSAARHDLGAGHADTFLARRDAPFRRRAAFA